MIDFRYHLVSIVSIFLALAVGIVLGAGPLKGQIGDSLTKQLGDLRGEMSVLRTDRDTALRQLQARDAFGAETAGRLVVGALTGTRVAVVGLPGSDTAAAQATVSTLEKAGGSVSSRTLVTDEWLSTDADKVAERAALATELARDLRVTPDSDGADLATVLAATLAHKPGSGVPVQTARSALQKLADAGLVEAAPDTLELADVVVLVGGRVGDEKTGPAAATSLVALAAALDAASRGAVLASDVASAPADGTSVVLTARQDATVSKVLSTVDDLSVPMGQVSIVYALVQQQGGGVGQYGLSDGVTAVYPPAPATSS